MLSSWALSDCVTQPSLDRFGRYHLSSRIFSDEMAEGYLASYRASEGDRSLIVKIYRDDRHEHHAQKPTPLSFGTGKE